MSQQQNRFRNKMKIHKGDQVVVISGANKGQKGEVLRVYPTKGRVLVKGVNVVTRHLKPQMDNDFPDGGRIEREAPINVSNVMVIDPKSGEATRIGKEKTENGWVRVSKKSGETIG